MDKVILVGNPNTGKTTLFNSLTKSTEKASNWHGVTVEAKIKRYKYKGKEVSVADVPGMYSLFGFSNEEKIASEYLKAHKNNLIVNICDANNLKRNIFLTLELVNSGYNVIVAVNMCNEVKLYDYDKLSKALGVKFVEIDARKHKSVDKLKYEIFKYYSLQKVQKIHKTIKKDINIDDFKIENNKNSYKINDKVDKILLNKWLFLPLFCLSLVFIFYVVYGPFGGTISSFFSMIFNKIMDFLQKIIYCINMPIYIKKLLSEGVFGAIETLISFIPQILLLMFFINLLEDIGFMSRVAFMLDGFMRKLGLTGKSLFSLMMGYGCTTTAILTTRNLENENLRKRTILLLPYASCSAKLPIFLTIASLFFERYKFLFVFALYIFAVLIQIIMAVIIKKIIPQNQDVFILEMPKYRAPYLKKILTDSFVTLKDFLSKTVSLLIVSSVLIWFLRSFDMQFRFLNGKFFESSILYFLASKISFVFAPLGLDNCGIVVALIFGLVAKELLVVGLAMINGVGGSLELLSASLVSSSSVCYFSLNSSIVFLVFILLYSPCFSAIISIKNELGIKYSLFVLVHQFLVAYVISLLVNLILVHVKLPILAITMIVLALIGFFVLILKKQKKHCRGNCYECGKV